MTLDIQPKISASKGIQDTTTESFERDVLQKSLDKPIIVDFWAPWCGPCKQLMPLLEKAVAAAKGAVGIVKVDIDQNPELAQIFRVQSVPTVYAFFKGQPVDGFTGAKSESEVKAFVEKLSKLAAPQSDVEDDIPDNAEAAKLMTAEGDTFLQAGNYDAAMERYAAALEADTAQHAALAGIGWCLMAQGDIESLREMAGQLDEGQKKAPRLQALLSVLAYADAAAGVPPVESLEKKLAKNPKDHSARYDLALQKIAAANLEGAIESLVELTRMDREWNEQKARKLLIDLFEAMGPSHPLTAPWRRKLSAVLFS
jgi:putative thioredoxin